MDIAKLKQKALDARTKTVEINETKTLTVLIPSQLEILKAASATNGEDTGLAEAGIKLLLSATKAWSGFVASDFVEGEPEDVVPFDAELLEAYLKDHVAESTIAAAVVWSKMLEDGKRKEEQAKN
jgi:hypothetical protein